MMIGGTRFIGPHVVRALVTSGHQVTVFHRGQSKADLPPGVEHIAGDRRELQNFSDHFKKLSPDVRCLTSGCFPHNWMVMQSNPLTTLSVKEIKRAVAIRERIDGLQRDLDRITGAQRAPVKDGAPRRKKRRMSAAARARISAAAKARWAKRSGKQRVSRIAAAKAKGRSPGAPLKERIVQTLKTAGRSGVTVKDLAAKLGTSYGNVSVWFHTTAKGINEIKKVEPGRFAWAS